MNARKLFSMSEEEIVEYFSGLDLLFEFTKEGRLFPTTLDERLFGLTHYSKPCAIGRRLIKKFPILQVDRSVMKIFLSTLDGKMILVEMAGRIQVTKSGC